MVNDFVGCAGVHARMANVQVRKCASCATWDDFA
jgi:hypothetical protein